MSFVRGVVTAQCGADWVWPGCHAPRSKLARVETIWVMVTDSTVDSGSTSSCLPKQIARSHGYGLLADGLGQHEARQVHGGHMVGEDRRQMT